MPATNTDIYTFHDPSWEPDGEPFGAAAICLTPAKNVVLVRWTGGEWMIPGGRPEPGESWEDTMRREVMEEALAQVKTAQLVGYVRGERPQSDGKPRIKVRSLWKVDVDLLPWHPQHEMVDRIEVAPSQALDELKASHIGSH